MRDSTHRAKIVFTRDGYRSTVVSYLWISIGILVNPAAAAIRTLEDLAAEHGTTLADCEEYSLLPVAKLTAKQRAADARMSWGGARPPSPKALPYR